MTYAVGGQIQASDYNGFVGTTAVNAAYANDGAAQNKVAALIGVGYGTRGYGQTSTNISVVSSGVAVSAGQWNNLRSAMATLNTHTGSGLTLQGTVASGGTIQAFDGSGGRPNLSTLISTLDTNRNNADVTDMTVSSALTSSTSASWTGTIFHEFTVNFGSENAARYYFNSGGQIRFSGSRTGGSATTVNTNWTNLLTGMGTIKMGASTTTYTGSGGTITNNVGYFGLTGTYQEIFIHYGVAPYSASYYSIQVRRESYVGANGGNGSLVRCYVTFFDDGYANVDGTTTSQIDQYKATGVLTISNPTFATVSGL